MSESPTEHAARLALLRDLPILHDLAAACDRFSTDLVTLSQRTMLSDVTSNAIKELRAALETGREESGLDKALDGRTQG